MSFLNPLTNYYTLSLPLTPLELSLRRSYLDQSGRTAYLTPFTILLLYLPTRHLSLPSTFTHLLPTPSPLPLTLAYTSYLVLLSFHHTGNDYMHLTKSLAHIAVSQLPWQYLLAIKSPLSPLQLLLGLSHEELNPLHRNLGRVIHGLLAAHAVLYLNFFVRMTLLGKALARPVIWWGITAFVAFNVLGLLALPQVRRRVYHRVFYRSHVALSAVVLVLIYFHVPYTRTYVWQAGACYVFNAGSRMWLSSPKVQVRIEKVEGTSLLRLRVRREASGFLGRWTPGQHVYLKRGHSLVYPKTPLTIVAFPGSSGNNSGDATVDLVVRNLGGPQTGWLAGQRSAMLQLEGSYGSSKTYLPQLFASRTGEPVLLIAGGVGVTYTLPVYLALLAHYRSGAGVRFVWFVKSRLEVRWVLDMLGRAECDVDVAVYITGEEGGEKGVELEKGKRRVKVYGPKERENVARIMGAELEEREGKAYVFVCGPTRMAEAVRKEVGLYGMSREREVVFHEEQFGFGGS